MNHNDNDDANTSSITTNSKNNNNNENKKSSLVKQVNSKRPFSPAVNHDTQKLLIQQWLV